jgi:hypothetical protein
MITSADIIKAIVLSVLGTSGIFGIVFGLINRKINNALSAAEASQKKKRENRITRTKLDDDMFQKIGRLLFWLYKAVKTGTSNGDLDKAYCEFEAAEQRRKEFKNGIYAEAEQDC